VTVELVDSVLYDSTDSGTVTGSGGGGGGSPLALATPAAGGATTTISWSGGTGPFTAFVDGPGAGGFTQSPTCTNDTASPCSIATTTNGTYKVYVKDGSGATSNTVTFNK
jgi:hypothetical protein